MKKELKNYKNKPEKQLRPFAVKYRIQFGARLREKRFLLKKIFFTSFSRVLRVSKAKRYFKGFLLFVKSVKLYSKKGNLFIFFKKNYSKRHKFFSFLLNDSKHKKTRFCFLFLLSLYKKRKKLFYINLKGNKTLRIQRLKRKLMFLRKTFVTNKKKREKKNFVNKKLKKFFFNLIENPRCTKLSLYQKFYYKIFAKVYPSSEIRYRSIEFFLKLYKKLVQKTQNVFFYHYSIAKVYKNNLKKLRFSSYSKYKNELKSFIKHFFVLQRKKFFCIYSLYAFYSLRRSNITSYSLKKRNKLIIITIAYKKLIRYIFILNFMRKNFQMIFNSIVSLALEQKNFLDQSNIFCFKSISIVNEMLYLNKTRHFKINFCTAVGYNYFLLRTEFKTRFLKRKERKKDLLVACFKRIEINSSCLSIIEKPFFTQYLTDEYFLTISLRHEQQLYLLRTFLDEKRINKNIPLYFPCYGIKSRLLENPIYKRKKLKKKKNLGLIFKKNKRMFLRFSKQTLEKRKNIRIIPIREETLKTYFRPFKDTNLTKKLLTNLKLFFVLKQNHFCKVVSTIRARKACSKNFYKNKFLKGLFAWLSHKSKYNLRVYQTTSKMYSKWIFFFNYTLNYYLFSKLFFILVHFLFFILFNKLKQILNLLKLQKFEFCYDFIKFNSNERYVLGIKPKTIITTFNRRTLKGSLWVKS